MRKHRQVLAAIVDELTALDPGCSIIVGGSMARGEERDDSDIDIFVCFSREPEHWSDLIAEGNRDTWHTFTEREGIVIDIGWKLLGALPNEIPDDREMVPYPLALATVVRDPSGQVRGWIDAMKGWLGKNPWVEEVWGKQLEEMGRHKVDPSYPLELDEEGFRAHLKALIARRKGQGPARRGVNVGPSVP